MIQEMLKKVLAREDLSGDEAVGVMNEIMSGNATPAQIAGYLVALRMKGETVDEIAGSAQVMREKAVTVKSTHAYLVDTCGTGGDSLGTINVSTMAAFVAAGAGVTVAKHGNRSVSSHCGSADLLRELGVKVDASLEVVETCLEEVGIAFLFAPLMHGAMKYAMPPRKELAVRTIFNILGPLTNPAGARSQVMGVFDPALCEPLANVLKKLGSEHVFVIHGNDGMDEVSLTDTSFVAELTPEGEVKTYQFDPRDYGLNLCNMDDLKGGEPADSAKEAHRILDGRERGPKRDIVVLNAALAIVVGKKAADIKEGLAKAVESLDSGAAYTKLKELVSCSNR